MKLYVSVAIISLVLFGCAAYELQPQSVSHPANTQAMALPERTRSRTLAYDREDMPTLTVAAAQKDNHDAHHSATQASAEKTVVGEGKVIATVPNASQLVVEHGEIKGFMEPMTMGYQIAPPALLEGLQSGDRVRFTIDVPKKTIIKVEKLK